MKRDFGATSLTLREFDATLCARHCVARLGSPHGCATKQTNWQWQKLGTDPSLIAFFFTLLVVVLVGV